MNMIAEELQEPQEHIEPELTQEQIDEQEIRQQPDCSFEIKRSDDPINSIIYTAVASKGLNKKVVSFYRYIEEVERNNVVGRLLQGLEKQSMEFDVEVDSTLLIEGIRPAERRKA